MAAEAPVPDQPAAPPTKVVLLFGRTGAGKSHLGNTLLSKPGFFTTGATLGSVTNLESLLEGKTDDGSITIFDSIGIGDTAIPHEQVVDHMAETVRKLRDGIHVLFFVIRFDRFTEVEHETFMFVVEHLFGRAVLNNMYVIFTRSPEHLVEGDVDARTDFLRGEAEINVMMNDVWRMMNRNAQRFVFVDNPDPELTKNAAKKALHAAQVVATRDTILPIIRGWMAGRYRNESMVEARKAYAKHLADEQAKRQGELEAQAKRIAEVEVLKVQAKSAEDRHKHEIELLKLQHTHEMEKIKMQHEAEIAAEKKVQETIRAQIAARPPPPPPAHSHCFAANTLVLLADGRSVPARSLRVKDQVLAVDSAGKRVFSPVYYSTNHVGWDDVVTITAEDSISSKQYTVQTTSEHLIYAARSPSAGFKQPMIASDVQVGDAIWIMTKDATRATQGRVVAVVTERRKMEFQNVLVLANCMIAGDEGGVLASSYCINHRWQVWDSLDLRLLYHVYPDALSSDGVRRYVEAYDNVVEVAVPKIRDAALNFFKGIRSSVAARLGNGERA